VQQLDEIEPGLSLVSRQLSTPAGRLDLFCRDVHGNYVVVELKKTQGTDQVVGQILRYMGWVREISRKQRSRYHHRWKKDDALRYALKARWHRSERIQIVDRVEKRPNTWDG